MRKFCEYQIKLKEDSKSDYRCTAHLGDGLCGFCGFNESNIQSLDLFLDGKKYLGISTMFEGTGLGCCQDFKLPEKLREEYKKKFPDAIFI